MKKRQSGQGPTEAAAGGVQNQAAPKRPVVRLTGQEVARRGARRRSSVQGLWVLVPLFLFQVRSDAEPQTADTKVEHVGSCSVELRRLEAYADLASRAAYEVTVRNAAGAITFRRQGHRFRLEKESGHDLNGDGLPEIVILNIDVGDNPYVYFFVTCGGDTTLIKEIQNRYGFLFEKASDGRMLIVVPDDGFAFNPDFSHIYHYDLYMPELRFALVGDRLVDVGSKYRSIYDREIAGARRLIPASKLQQFREGKIQDEFERGLVEGPVLRIVFSFLYSGRAEEAWRELERNWPKGDVARIKKAILAGRQKGSLRLAERRDTNSKPD